jgi:hypothetical protein
VLCRRMFAFSIGITQLKLGTLVWEAQCGVEVAYC